MTGTSARDTFRPVKRMRPSASGTMTPMAPPVLFRLPSIATPTSEPNGAALVGTADGMSLKATAAMPPVQAAINAATAMPTATASLALIEKKAAGQRLLNIAIMVLLLMAVVVITWLTVRPPKPTPEVASDSKAKSGDSLGSLSGLQLPQIAAGPTTAAIPTASTKTNASAVASNSAEGSYPTSTSKDQSQRNADNDAAGSLMLGFDSGEHAIATSPSTPIAHVQLGKPAPVLHVNSTALADSQRNLIPPANNTQSITPRYETVSTPTAPQSSSEKSSSGSTNSGASPSLWDGAKATPTSELELSGSSMPSPPVAASEPARTPSSILGAPSQSSAQPTSNSDGFISLGGTDAHAVSADKTSAATATANGTVTAATDPLGVTVGGGLKEPSNLASATLASVTATPDLDVAAISQRYIEYSRQRNVTAPISTATPNSYPQGSTSAPVGRTAVPSPAYGNQQNHSEKSSQNFPLNAAPQAGLVPNDYPQNAHPQNAYPQDPATPVNSGINASATAIGTAGNIVAPYVRNAPGTVASGAMGGGGVTTNNPYSNTMSSPAPASDAGGVTAPNSAGMGGHAIPPRSTAPATPEQAGGVVQYVQSPSTGLRVPTYVGPAYGQPTSGPAGANLQQYTAGPFGVPVHPNASSQPNAASQANAFGQPNVSSQPALSSMAPVPTGNPGARATVPVPSPYPGGQAPLALIGQSGFANAPSGDFANTPPIPVTGTIGYGTSSPGGMPAGMPPAGANTNMPVNSGTSANRAQTQFGTMPHYR